MYFWGFESPFFSTAYSVLPGIASAWETFKEKCTVSLQTILCIGREEIERRKARLTVTEQGQALGTTGARCLVGLARNLPPEFSL